MIRSKEFYAERFISVREAAQLLDLTPAFVRQLTRDGTLPGAEGGELISREAVRRYSRIIGRGGRRHANGIKRLSERIRPSHLAYLNSRL